MLYLYLASRSKKGIKLICTLNGSSQVTSPLKDIASLDLPLTWKNQIQKMVYENRMLYEPWVESAASYAELRERLKTRGYSNIPMGAIPMLRFPNGKIPVANTRSCKVKRTMIRKIK